MAEEPQVWPAVVKFRRILAALVVAAGLAGSSPIELGSPAHAAATQVDLALVLAVDCSYSVDAREFRLQMQGIASAFRQKAIHEAITRGPLGRIAVALVEWSDEQNQVMPVTWQLIDSREAAVAFADIVAATPRRLAEGGTAIGTALQFAAAAVLTAPVETTRRVIDLSSDGRNNRGIKVTIARDEVVAKGITINALAIINEWPTLNYYFDQQVVGGPYHFVIVANDYAAYAEAIYRKLLKEITGPGIS
jgi:hypothetical protein